MDILNIKIEDILKFPFKNKDWINTFGVYLLISLFIAILFTGIFFIIFFGSMVLVEAYNQMSLWSLFILILASIPVSIFFFLVQLYLQGYLVEMMRNIKEGKKEDLPYHKEISKKLKLGFIQFVLTLGPITISALLFVSAIAMIISGSILIQQTIVIPVILIFLGIAIIIFTSVLFLAITVFVLPAMLYIFLETNSIKRAYCILNIKLVAQNAWKGFLVVYAISMIGSVFISVFGQFPGFGLLVITFGIIYIAFVRSFVLGKIFQDLDKLKLFK